MNSVLKRILETGYVRSANGELVKLHSNIPPEEGEFLQKVIAEVKPKVSLEVGLAFGISALFICEALTKVQALRHIIIEPDDWGGLNNLKEAGYEQLIELHNLPSFRALPRLEAEGRKIDFAFIDGMHTFDYVMLDFFYIDRLLRVGGVVVFDDANWESIRKVCRYIVTNRSYTVFPSSQSDTSGKISLRHRLLFDAPVISKHFRRIAKPEILEPDFKLQLADCRYIAFMKERDDVFGDGSNGTRRFDFHRDF